MGQGSHNGSKQHSKQHVGGGSKQTAGSHHPTPVTHRRNSFSHATVEDFREQGGFQLDFASVAEQLLDFCGTSSHGSR